MKDQDKNDIKRAVELFNSLHPFNLQMTEDEWAVRTARWYVDVASEPEQKIIASEA